MTKRLLAGLALLVMVQACSARADGPPHLEEDRTACAHCGMLVSERTFAAAYRARDPQGRIRGEARIFDDIGCLRDAARAEADAASFEYWFHDARTREWIEGSRAVIVHAPGVRTPMAGGMLAYASAADAVAAASEHRGRVVGGVLDVLKAGQ